MKILKFILVYSFLICNFANATPCQNDILLKLYTYMKPQLIKVSWLDLNSVDPADSCQFLLRYYPCNEITQHELDAMLPTALAATTPYCQIVSHGTHEQTEGYCTLRNIVLRCEK
jgi:hypothetical protein